MNRTNVFNFSKITCANINCQPLSIADTWEISTKNLSLPKSYVTCTWIKNQTAQPNTMNNKRNFMQLYSLGWISSGWLEGRKLFLLFLPSATWLQTPLSLLNHAILTPSSGQGHVLHYFSSQCTRVLLPSSIMTKQRYFIGDLWHTDAKIYDFFFSICRISAWRLKTPRNKLSLLKKTAYAG